MAERRMFAKKIIDSDDFLDMPLSAQALYFHLGMRADDDGFVNNARIIYRLIGASADDLKLLIDGKYLTDFKNGIMVINHWKINNFIRKDRYVETMFLREKQQLFCDDTGAYIVETNQAYTVPKTTQNLWSTNGQPVVNQWSTNGQPSIGKDSIDKVSLGKSSIGEERIEKINLGEGSINTTPAPYYENKYEEVFSSDRAIAHLPTDGGSQDGKSHFTIGQQHYEVPGFLLEEQYQDDGDEYMRPAQVNDGIAFPSEGRGTTDEVLEANSRASEFSRVVDEVLPSESEEILSVSRDIRPAQEADEEKASHFGRGVSFADGEGVLKPVEGPYGRIAFPSGGRGTALAVDEVLPSESDKALYDMRSESARDTSLKPVEGPYGRGIVRLTDGQLADLKSRLGESQLNRYMDKLASFISSRGARIRSHYDTINKWYEEDYKSGIAPPKSQAYEPSHYRPAKFQPEKPRYGNFDPDEAFRYALERSRRESEKELREEGVDI